MTAQIDKRTLDRIEKLLAMANSTSLAEASIARKRVAKLLDSLGLSEEDFTPGALSIKEVQYVATNGDRSPWKVQMFTAIAYIMECHAAYSRTVPVEFYFYGRGGRPEVAAYLVSIVENNMYRKWEEYKAHREFYFMQKLGSKERKQWFEMFGSSVVIKVGSLMKQMSENDRSSLDKEVKGMIADLHDIKLQQPKTKPAKKSAASMAGYKAGLEQEINLGLRTEAPNESLS